MSLESRLVIDGRKSGSDRRQGLEKGMWPSQSRGERKGGMGAGRGGLSTPPQLGKQMSIPGETGCFLPEELGFNEKQRLGHGQDGKGLTPNTT